MRSDVAVIMFDEPLTVIDPHLKWVLRSKLKELHHRIRRTMIYVTHDQTEALTFADQVVVMNDGEIVQTGTPVELFERPRHTFVGHFIGSPGMNVLPCEVKGGKVRFAGRVVETIHAKVPDGAGKVRARRASRVREFSPNGIPIDVVKVSDAGRYRIVETRHAAGAHQAAGRRERRHSGRPRPDRLRSRPHPGLSRRLGGRMNKIVNQKAWFFVLPVFVMVAFNALIPLMTVVNFSVQETFGNNVFSWSGVHLVRAGAAFRALPCRPAAPDRVHRPDAADRGAAWAW